MMAYLYVQGPDLAPFADHYMNLVQLARSTGQPLGLKQISTMSRAMFTGCTNMYSFTIVCQWGWELGDLDSLERRMPCCNRCF